MPSNEPESHLTPGDLSQYYAGELSDDRAVLVEDHLAGCDRCTDLATALQNFGELWQGWNAQAHAEAMAAVRAGAVERLQTALERAAGTASDLRDRLAGWLQRLPRLPLSEMLESVRLPVPMALEPAAIRTHGEAQSRGTVAVRLSPDRWLASVSLPQSSRLELSVSGVAGDERAPLTILTASTGEGAPQVRRAVWNPAADAWVTTFPAVAAGDYLVAVEPWAG